MNQETWNLPNYRQGRTGQSRKRSRRARRVRPVGGVDITTPPVTEEQGLENIKAFLRFYTHKTKHWDTP